MTDVSAALLASTIELKNRLSGFVRACAEMTDCGPDVDAIQRAEDAIMAYRAAASEQAVAGEWIDWSGGRNPAQEQTVDLKMRDGVMAPRVRASLFDWDHRDGAGDIIAYRVVTAADESSVGTSNASEQKTNPQGKGAEG